MSGSARDDIPEAVLDQAIQWLVRLQSGAVDPAMHAACEQWRRAQPSHENAWQALQVNEQRFRLAAQLTAGVARDTLANAAASHSRRKVLKLLGLGVCASGLGALTVQQTWRGVSADYVTRTGERQRFQLVDGTLLQLNTHSRADAVFSAERRLITLREGEVFIQTGADTGGPQARRPFWVQTAEARLEAIGTAFNVRQEPGYTRLSVEEGAVAVHLASGRGPLITAGNECLISAGRVEQVQGDVLQASAWTRGAVVARQMRLQQLVEELGRYRTGWLLCDGAVADLRISGVFQLEDIDRALAGLSRSLPVRIERRTRYWVRIVAA